MSIEIKDKSGKTTIKLDDSDQKKDVVIIDGKEVPYDEAAREAEEKAAKDKPKTEVK